MTEMAETHVELNQFPVPRVGPRHSTIIIVIIIIINNNVHISILPMVVTS